MRRYILLVILGLVVAACGGGATATNDGQGATLSGVEIDVHETPG